MDDVSDKNQDESAKADQNPTNEELANLQNVESLINMNIAKLARFKDEIKPQNEMLKSFLENDETFQKLTDLAKKAGNEKNKRKRELMEDPSAKSIKEKIDSLKESISESQEALSTYLREYQRLTGSNEFEGEDGELRQIVYVAKLVRKTDLNR